MSEIRRLRKWVNTVRGWRRRTAFVLWLNWFTREALQASKDAAERQKEEKARDALPKLPVKGTCYRGVL